MDYPIGYVLTVSFNKDNRVFQATMSGKIPEDDGDDVSELTLFNMLKRMAYDDIAKPQGVKEDQVATIFFTFLY